MSDKTIGYTVSSEIGNGTKYRVTCVSAGASDPGTLVDPHGVVASGGLDQPSAGKYTLTLDGNYQRIEAQVTLVDTTLGQVCQVYQIDDIDANGDYVTPIIYWMTFTSSTGAAVQTTGKKFIIDLTLYP